MRFAISSKGVAIAVALAFFLLASTAHGESIRFPTKVTCTAHPSGNTIDLDPGRYIPEPDWLRLDSDIVRLQNDVTRLGAENVELRKPDDLSWKLVAIGVLIGVGVSAYATR